MLATTFRDRTRNLLAERSRKLRYVDIAEATGLTTRWLEEFATHRIENPGVNAVETLYTYLTGAAPNL